jgi:hypothetical protein
VCAHAVGKRLGSQPGCLKGPTSQVHMPVQDAAPYTTLHRPELRSMPHCSMCSLTPAPGWGTPRAPAPAAHTPPAWAACPAAVLFTAPAAHTPPAWAACPAAHTPPAWALAPAAAPSTAPAAVPATPASRRLAAPSCRAPPVAGRPEPQCDTGKDVSVQHYSTVAEQLPMHMLCGGPCFLPSHASAVTTPEVM